MKRADLRAAILRRLRDAGCDCSPSIRLAGNHELVVRHRVDCSWRVERERREHDR